MWGKDSPSLLGDQGQLTLEVAADIMAAVVYADVILAIERVADGARVLRMEVTAPPNATGQRASRAWDYGSFAFHSMTVAGLVLADSLKNRSVQVGEVCASLSIADQAQWERLPSYSTRDRLPLEWPQIQARFGFAGGQLYPQSRPKVLVGAQAPTFPSYEVACEAFFHGLTSLGPPQSDADLLALRLVDQRCRLSRLVFGPLGLDVHVHGPATAGARLEITSNRGHQETVLDEFQTVGHFEFPDGVPPEWWVVVSRGQEWLDFRWAMPYSPMSVPGVEIIRDDVEPADEVAALMASGENLTREFKSQLPADGDSRRKLARTVAAFANGEGGVILFGINRDEFSICGVEGEFPRLRDQLSSLVADWLVPRPDVDIRSYAVDGQLVIALEVGAGQTPPYGIDRASPRYYLRRSGSTVPAQPDDIRRLVAARKTLADPTNGLRWA